jgi:hypothetical protein
MTRSLAVLGSRLAFSAKQQFGSRSCLSTMNKVYENDNMMISFRSQTRDNVRMHYQKKKQRILKYDHMSENNINKYHQQNSFDFIGFKYYFPNLNNKAYIFIITGVTATF